MSKRLAFLIFFFNDTATTEIYTLSLHDALPISLGVEVNVIPVGRIFRTIVQSLGGRQLLLLAACRGNRVDIEIAVPLADERKCLSIRRPAMPIRRRLLRDASRRAAAERQNVNKRAMLLLLAVADD